MVIHTKQKAKLHVRTPKKATIKGNKAYTVSRGPKIKSDAGVAVKKRSYRKSTIHSSRETGPKGFRQYRDSIRMSRQTVKKKNSSIKVAGAVGTQAALSHMEGGDETATTRTVFYVNVKLKTCYDMMREYSFNKEQTELMEEMMSMFGSTSGVTPQSALSQAEVDAVLQDISDPIQRSMVSFALTKVGYPYSQQYRDTGNYFDCSSLAFYSWKEAGIDISYAGSNTAAAEGQGLDSAGHTVEYDDMQPGDLIFYSYKRNGRYKNISHVAIYVGNGKVVEASCSKPVYTV